MFRITKAAVPHMPSGASITGRNPMKRAGQSAELAPVYVMLATEEASYVSSATIAVTGGTPIV